MHIETFDSGTFLKQLTDTRESKKTLINFFGGFEICVFDSQLSGRFQPKPKQKTNSIGLHVAKNKEIASALVSRKKRLN